MEQLVEWNNEKEWYIKTMIFFFQNLKLNKNGKMYLEISICKQSMQYGMYTIETFFQNLKIRIFFFYKKLSAFNDCP